MLKWLILKNQKPTQLTIAVLGSISGMLLLLGSIQLYFDLTELFKNDSGVLSDHYIVLNKEVGMLNTLSFSNSGFSEKELNELKNQAFVKNTGTFKSGTFNARAFIDPNAHSSFPALYTDIFFESVSSLFLDIKPEDWHWEQGQKNVPIVVPSDYLNLYNFGFAPSQGLPQISKKTASMAGFKIKLWGNNAETIIDAHIAGFSNRINTILVPEAFLDYANATYGTNKNNPPSRIIINTPDPASPELSSFFKSKGYETNQENIKQGKLNSLLRIVLKICLFIGGIIILLSLLGFIQYSQLIINRSSYELQTLIKIGYNYKILWRNYLFFYSAIFAGTLIIGLTLLHYFKGMFSLFMLKNDFELSAGLNNMVYTCGGMLCFLLLALNALTIYMALKKMAQMKRRT